MPNRRAITLVAGATFTAVRVSGAYHRMKMKEVANLQIDVQSSVDAFASTEASNAELGNTVELVGHGRDGVLGVPADYNAIGTPAAATEVARVRTTGGAGGTLIVDEYEF